MAIALWVATLALPRVLAGDGATRACGAGKVRQAERHSYYFPDAQFHKPASDNGKDPLPDDRRPFCVQKDEAGFDIAFIEFDQRGDFWCRDQLAIARHQLKKRTRGKKPLLVQYVHGWHHNAQEDANRDVAGFRQLLRYLAQSDYVNSQNYRVFGVYLGWRGEQYRSGKDPIGRGLWLPSQLSFYPIKHIGSEVGTMPMLSEAVFWMVHEARATNADARTVLIGHSFGAMVLENAIAQGIASSAAMNTGSGASVPAPADLILLLNAASNSLRAKGVTEMFDRMGASAGSRFVSRDRPLIISVTSTGDWATGFFYPLGTGFANITKTFRPYKTLGRSSKPLPPRTTQRDFVTRTPGHNSLLRSHFITVDKDRIAPSARKVATRTACQHIFDRNLADPYPREPNSRIWPFRSVSQDGSECRSEIRADPDAWMQTAYWIVQAPKEIIADHGDIFNEQALCLYAALFRIENPKGEPQRRGPRQLQMLPPDISSSRTDGYQPRTSDLGR